MTEKRGMTHIEIVLSFVIFVVALAFALIFFSPGSGDRLIDSSLVYVLREIEKNTSHDFIVISVSINNEKIGDDESEGDEIHVINIEIEGIENEKMKTSAWTIDGTSLKSARLGDFVFIEDGSERWVDIEFIMIMFNEEFEDDTVNEGVFQEEYYDIASSESKKVISERKFIELAKEYEEDYARLKESFNLPARVNFEFSLQFSNSESIIAKKEIPENLEVFTEKKRVEVLRENNEVVFADLMVGVW